MQIQSWKQEAVRRRIVCPKNAIARLLRVRQRDVRAVHVDPIHTSAEMVELGIADKRREGAVLRALNGNIKRYAVVQGHDLAGPNRGRRLRKLNGSSVSIVIGNSGGLDPIARDRGRSSVRAHVAAEFAGVIWN